MKAQLKMHYINSKKSYVIFWSIMLGITVLGFMIALYLRNRGYTGNFNGNNMPAVIIFGAISSMVAYNETFPYVLNMGSTRKNFVINFAAYNILLSLILSVTFTILSLVESFVNKLLGFSNKYIGQIIMDFSLTEILYKIVICFSFTLAISALFALIAGIYYKKGMMFLFGIGAAIMLIMFIPGVAMKVGKALEFIIMSLINKEGYMTMILYSLALFLACYMIIYPLARVSQVKR